MTLLADAPAQTIVTLYSQPGCGPCVGVKSYLERAGIPFEIRNIREDQDAMNRLVELGYTGTPVIEHEGGHFKGYDPEKLEALKLF